ncbi:MAG TPA: TonB-dependent receptor, partial [Membranihabitans sp.]|nr:TonB-dependent receptor [Membranihabitans sp.]
MKSIFTKLEKAGYSVSRGKCFFLMLGWILTGSLQATPALENPAVTNAEGVALVEHNRDNPDVPFPLDVEGTVVDQEGEPLIGVNIQVKGTEKGSFTDFDGRFTIDDIAEDDILIFSYLGYNTQEVPVGGNSNLDVVLESNSQLLDGVVISAYGTKQSRESVLSSISTVNTADLRIPSSNITTGFAGKLPGVIAFQRSGEPGLDDAQFFIRGITSFSASGKKDPLILVDGIEMSSRDLARVNVDDIAAFSILKDANAAALYGARGANGVILISTKMGRPDGLSISLRAETSNSYNSELVALAEPITYMKLHNEAVRTRDAEVVLPYSLTKIRETELGTDPTKYPSVDWYDYMIANKALNQRLNLNLTGGGQTVQYYLAANYQNEQGIIKENKENLIDNNIDIDRLQVRSNVTIKFAPTTTGVIRAFGNFDDVTGPPLGGADVFHAARNASPVQFLPFYPPDSNNVFTDHILFGSGPELGVFTNPFASVASTFKQEKSSMMLMQVEMEHNFIDNTLDGLSLRGVFNIMRHASNAYYRGYRPFYYNLATTIDDSYQLNPLNPDTGTEYLDYYDGPRTARASVYGEVRLAYNKIINDVHDISTTLVGTMRSETSTAEVDSLPTYRLQASLPRRNLSSAGRLAYGYDSRYFLEFNFGLNGTERFAEDNRWGFFPSVGIGWNIGNEAFMIGIQDVVSELKIRGTYGLVGNDQIGSVYDRFFYLSRVNVNGPGYWFGLDRDYTTGISIDRYANELITWEIAKKTNIGLDLGLFRKFTITSEFFMEERSNILQTRTDVPSTLGLRTIPQANIGIAQGRGFETSLQYLQTFGPNLWVVANGNFTYATSEFLKYEEPDYSDVPWRSRIGLKLSQPMGYIAERFFIDDEEVSNAPVQEFGEYRGGDIKYKDISGDGRINSDDLVPIGFPTVPEIIYGG